MPHAHASGFPSSDNDRGGQAPALRAAGRYRRARACPSPCHARGRIASRPGGLSYGCPSPCTDRGGQAPALRAAGRYRRARACPSPSKVEGFGLIAFVGRELWKTTLTDRRDGCRDAVTVDLGENATPLDGQRDTSTIRQTEMPPGTTLAPRALCVPRSHPAYPLSLLKNRHPCYCVRRNRGYTAQCGPKR